MSRNITLPAVGAAHLAMQRSNRHSHSRRNSAWESRRDKSDYVNRRRASARRRARRARLRFQYEDGAARGMERQEEREEERR